MGDIHESISIDVPFDHIPELAERFLASLRREGVEAIVPLSLTVAFDAVIGNRIARAVAQRLLQRFKIAFEDAYRETSRAARPFAHTV